MCPHPSEFLRSLDREALYSDGAHQQFQSSSSLCFRCIFLPNGLQSERGQFLPHTSRSSCCLKRTAWQDLTAHQEKSSCSWIFAVLSVLGPPQTGSQARWVLPMSGSKTCCVGDMPSYSQGTLPSARLLAWPLAEEDSGLEALSGWGWGCGWSPLNQEEQEMELPKEVLSS